jgi:hypothetical protein
MSYLENNMHLSMGLKKMKLSTSNQLASSFQLRRTFTNRAANKFSLFILAKK